MTNASESKVMLINISLDRFIMSVKFHILYCRLSGKSRYVDFLLEKPRRRFSVGKAETSIFR